MSSHRFPRFPAVCVCDYVQNLLFFKKKKNKGTCHVGLRPYSNWITYVYPNKITSKVLRIRTSTYLGGGVEWEEKCTMQSITGPKIIINLGIYVSEINVPGY